MKRELAPSWLELLLATQFFTICANHPTTSRNECNIFCIDCITPPIALCYNCRLEEHSTHRVIQVRRSSYHDVVRVSEVEDILDISDIQTYVINSARVVFLNERPVCKPTSSSSHYCKTCGRGLIEAFRFCSLGCNLRGIKKDIKDTIVTGDGSAVKTEVIGADNGDAKSESEIDNHNDSNKNEEPPVKRARHRRKGIPHRAPFF
ncbi:hypothetical protein ACP4OV_006833 [Aristida adscensionis]